MHPRPDCSPRLRSVIYTDRTTVSLPFAWLAGSSAYRSGCPELYASVQVRRGLAEGLSVAERACVERVRALFAVRRSARIYSWARTPSTWASGEWRPPPGSETNGARVLNGRNVFCGVERRPPARARPRERVEQQVDCAGISLWSPRWRASDEARRTNYIPRPRRVLQLDRCRRHWDSLKDLGASRSRRKGVAVGAISFLSHAMRSRRSQTRSSRLTPGGGRR